MENGNLILSVLPKDGTEYYCGGIRSRGLFEHAYGCFEITCVLPAYPGVCNAFWLMCDAMGSNQVAGGTDGVEIDIFETSDPAKRSFQHALHWDGYGEQHQSSARTVNPNLFKTNIYDGNYHTFTFVWSKESYSFYVDGEKTWKTSDGGICQIPLYMKVTAQIMGWTGTFDGNLVPCDVCGFCACVHGGGMIGSVRADSFFAERKKRWKEVTESFAFRIDPTQKM